MSKDFRQEYERHMKENTPDLWDRIESGLSEKQEPPAAMASRRRNKGVRRVYRIMGAAAAVLFAAVLMPVAYQYYFAGYHTKNSSAADMEGQAVKNEAAPPPEGMMPENAPEDMDGNAEAADQDQPPAEGENGDLPGQDGEESGRTDPENAIKEGQTTDDKQKPDYNSSEDSEHTPVQEEQKEPVQDSTEKYAVKIIGQAARQESSFTGIEIKGVYQAKVTETGREIMIAIPADMEVELLENGSYVLILNAAEEEAGYDYILRSVE